MNEKNQAGQVDNPRRCVSCGAKIKHKYCPKCGEKWIVPENDLSVLKFLGQNLWHLVHLDSKLFRSIRLLFTKPGGVTAAWVSGIRTPYLKPLQVFLITALFFYFFLPGIPIYFSSPDEVIEGYGTQHWMANAFHFDAAKVIAEKAEYYGLTFSAAKEQMAANSASLSKTFLFAIIPFWGLAMYALFYKKMPYFTPHMVLAMECMTFYMLCDLTMHAIIDIFGFPEPYIWRFLPFLYLTFLGYMVLVVRRLYQLGWIQATIKGLLMFFGFFVIFFLYRQMTTMGAIWFFHEPLVVK